MEEWKTAWETDKDDETGEQREELIDKVKMIELSSTCA